MRERDDRRLGGDRLRGNDRPVSASRILRVAELDLVVGRTGLGVRTRAPRTKSARIGSGGARSSRACSTAACCLMFRHAFETRADGATRLARPAISRPAFADFLAWRDFGFPTKASATASRWPRCRAPTAPSCSAKWPRTPPTPARSISPPARPTCRTCSSDRVDLAASVTRELEEETGIRADETEYDASWVVVYAPPRIACMKIMRPPRPPRRARRASRRSSRRETEPRTRAHAYRARAWRSR